MPDLKQSTATSRMIFMTDSSDHVAGKTGLTLAITASKAGGAFASISPVVVDRGSGWYSLALTAAHTDTLGDLVLHATAAGADPSDVRHNVVAGSLDADVSSRLAPAVAGRPLDVAANGVVNANIVSVDPALGADGTAQAGGGSTITLAPSASAVDDAYNGRSIAIVAGTGAGQGRQVLDYAGSTRVATVDSAWATPPDSTSKYALGDYGAASGGGPGPTAIQVADAMLTRPFPGNPGANTVAGILGGLPDLDEIRAEIAGQVAATPVAIMAGGIASASFASGTSVPLPASPPAAYATASAVAAVKADTGKVAGLVETATVNGSPVDRFKGPALAQAPVGSGSADPAAIVAAINAAGVRLRADGLDSVVVEAGINARQALSLDLAASAGIVAGAGSGLITIKGAGVAATRITATTDQSGNRLQVHLEPSN